jgi:hypothetical protein
VHRDTAAYYTSGIFPIYNSPLSQAGFQPPFDRLSGIVILRRFRQPWIFDMKFGRRWIRVSLGGLVACMASFWAMQNLALAADAAPVPLELNKLEPTGQNHSTCRVYFVVTNPESEPAIQFQLDLILFGKDGVIARRIALELAPLPPHKTAVRLFDVPNLQCDDIGQILVNDVLACRFGNQQSSDEAQRQACLDRITVSSRAKAPLTK